MSDVKLMRTEMGSLGCGIQPSQDDAPLLRDEATHVDTDRRMTDECSEIDRGPWYRDGQWEIPWEEMMG